MEIKSFTQQINEGLYDPGIFKAFFLAGGPGSGKTFVASSAFAGSGLKVVNSDIAFEREIGPELKISFFTQSRNFALFTGIHLESKLRFKLK